MARYGKSQRLIRLRFSRLSGDDDRIKVITMPNKQTGTRLEADQEAAQPFNEEADIIHLSIEDQMALVETILNPPEPNEALRKAADAHKRLVVETK
ncbi:DUF1778 domain-containing protein [Mesorhizobium sp. M1338]|uniref:type II toxin -antitoxin system TacA 1-like antitoxin n=1 Tax=Mesorhizobium sp. M1338 TaxID=2957085 RepID=UPI0033398611